VKDKISWRRDRRVARSQDVHDAHGQERDSDHCQPRKNELIHVLGRADPGNEIAFHVVPSLRRVRQSRISASQQIEQLPSCCVLCVASSRVLP
jgi:hypothetical protein